MVPHTIVGMQVKIFDSFLGFSDGSFDETLWSRLATTDVDLDTDQRSDIFFDNFEF